MITYAEFQVICSCGSLVLKPTTSPSEATQVMLDHVVPEPGHQVTLQVRTVSMTDWKPTAPKVRYTEDTWLYKRLKGDTIHRAGCSRVPAAKLFHWIWADTEPDEVILRWVKTGIYKLCTRCKPLEGTV